jgi:transposase
VFIPEDLDQEKQSSAPPIDIKTLHAKIGELILENDVLEGPFVKAGVLTLKR